MVREKTLLEAEAHLKDRQGVLLHLKDAAVHPEVLLHAVLHQDAAAVPPEDLLQAEALKDKGRFLLGHYLHHWSIYTLYTGIAGFFIV